MKKNLLCLAILSSLTAMASAQTSIEPTLADNQDLTSPSEAIELSDTVVRPDYVEIERLQNTKEILVLTKDNLQEVGNRTVTDALSTPLGEREYGGPQCDRHSWSGVRNRVTQPSGSH